jgi:release factor glutamine methyltransferase
VTATDVVERALELARENAEKNKVEVDLREGDMFEPASGRYDVIIFNPPYLPTAPDDLTHSDLDKALDGGPDGTEVTLRFLEQVNDFLAEDGRAYIVVSSLQDSNRIDEALLRQHLVARKRGSEKFDFETISVLEIRQPPKEARPGGVGAV